MENHTKLILSVLSIILVLSTSIFTMVISTKEKEIANLNEKISSKLIEIYELNIHLSDNKQVINYLNTSYKKLNNSYTYLSNVHEDLDLKYDELFNETNELIDDIEVYQYEIKKSIEWFNTNSVLNSTNKEIQIKNKLDENCLQITNDSCRIKTGCFYLINKNDIGLEYKSDNETSNREDKLQSLNEFIENDGGDCEDYSLFYKAEYNYFLNKCEDKKIILETYKIIKDNKSLEGEKYWLNYQKKWYFNNALNIEITEEIYPNVICGNMYDKNKDKISGHCLIAFTKEKIKSIADLDKLDKAIIIEPQDGSYKGKINEDIILVNKDNFINEKLESWINVVITDNDYFLFCTNEFAWKTYSSFYDELEIKKNNAINVISNQEEEKNNNKKLILNI